MLVNALLNAVIQVVVFGLVPLLWWLFAARRTQSFLSWVGLKPVQTPSPSRFWAALGAAGLYSVAVFALTTWLLHDHPTATALSAFQGQGWVALLPALLYALVQTSLSEELFFRGFLTKRLSARFGLPAGNALQALLFGSLHGLMLLGTAPGVAPLVAVVIGALAWSLGHVNERYAGGSILPGWAVHGTSNLLMALWMAFQ